MELLLCRPSGCVHELELGSERESKSNDGHDHALASFAGEPRNEDGVLHLRRHVHSRHLRPDAGL